MEIVAVQQPCQRARQNTHEIAQSPIYTHRTAEGAKYFVVLVDTIEMIQVLIVSIDVNSR